MRFGGWRVRERDRRCDLASAWARSWAVSFPSRPTIVVVAGARFAFPGLWAFNTAAVELCVRVTGTLTSDGQHVLSGFWFGGDISKRVH